MNFFNILFSVCTGTEIFPKLLDISLRRSIFHFILLTIACAFFILGGRAFPLWHSIDSTCNALSIEFGSLQIDNDGILPSKSPEKPRELFLLDNLRVNYSPSEQDELKLLDSDNSKFGVAWTPGILCAWMKLNSSDYLFMPLIYPEKNITIPRAPMTKSEGVEYIKKYASAKGPFNFLLSKVNFSAMKPALFFYISAIIFMAALFKIIVSAVLFTSIFAVIYSLVGRDALSSLPVKKLFVIGTYTAFPCIVIASFFPALELPFLDYQTVFLITFLFYLFIVFNRIQKSLNPKPEKKPDKADGDDEGIF
ncbi:MAG: hypothetical protein A2017_05180 [Lentisphaerae bacterium GWF2_44_16]|nr:MAG: hypothetical protein A2017_05180 [Lentisphaerae bacterium GWF2_44_16]